MAGLLLTGSTGQIGRELLQALARVGAIAAPGRDSLDLASADAIRAAIRATAPEIIVNAAAFASMDSAERDPGCAALVNGTAPGVIAEEAARAGALLVHYSSAYVFDGTGARPYREDDPPAPVNAYGRSKLAGEQAIAAAGGRHIILRLSWVHSLHGVNFLAAILRHARGVPELPVVDDQIGSPTWARTVAEVTARMLAQRRAASLPTGIFHLTAAGAVSRLGFAQRILAAARRAPGAAAQWARLRPVASADFPLPAARPKYCVLDNAKFRAAFGIEMPDWGSEVDACMAECGARA